MDKLVTCVGFPVRGFSPAGNHDAGAILGPARFHFDCRRQVHGKCYRADHAAGVVHQTDELANVGFADQVDLTFSPPTGVQGLTAQNVTLNKGQDGGKLEIAAADSLPPGQHAGTVAARGKFNGVQFETVAPVLITIEGK